MWDILHNIFSFTLYPNGQLLKVDLIPYWGWVSVKGDIKQRAFWWQTTTTYTDYNSGMCCDQDNYHLHVRIPFTKG